MSRLLALVLTALSLSAISGCGSKGQVGQQETDAALSRIEAQPESARRELDLLRDSYNALDQPKYIPFKIGITIVAGAESEFVREWCYYHDQGYDGARFNNVGIRIGNDHRRLDAWLDSERETDETLESCWLRLQPHVMWSYPEPDWPVATFSGK